jgi:hypothetical protein
MFLREEGEGSDLYCSNPEIQGADMGEGKMIYIGTP